VAEYLILRIGGIVKMEMQKLIDELKDFKKEVEENLNNKKIKAYDEELIKQKIRQEDNKEFKRAISLVINVVTFGILLLTIATNIVIFSHVWIETQIPLTKMLIFGNFIIFLLLSIIYYNAMTKKDDEE